MAPFVLKFKGNKSFSPFSNIADSDSLTRTWKVCTKIAAHLEQGQRLENLSWRLWHLQNLIVETDNAKSKREFKKLSKWMGDKLDKDKGRSIEELEAPDFKRTESTDKIRLRAEEKERNRDIQLHGGGGNSMKGMQYTFALDTNVRGRPAGAKKLDSKSTIKRPVPGTVTPKPGARVKKDSSPDTAMRELSPLGAPLSSVSQPATVALRFPTLFSNDFGPTALLCPPPSYTPALSYGEGSYSVGNTDSFDVSRPTFEFGLDELLGSDSSHSPSEMIQDLPSTTPAPPTTITRPALIVPTSPPSSGPIATPASLPPLVIPRTANPAALGGYSPFQEAYGQQHDTMAKHVRQGPSATPPARGTGGSGNGTSGSSSHVNHGNTAPGGVKSECSNCGATHTPLWRRGLNDELNCNACGLYCKLHKRPRPRTLRNTHGDGGRGSGWGGRTGETELVGEPVQCYNCSTTATPLWRKDDEGNTLCNACGLYLKLHGSKRPLSMKSDVIRKRSRHDAEKRPTTMNSSSHSPPSASPGASRRASPTPPPQNIAPEPFTGPSPNEMQYFPEYDFASESELMGSLGGGGGPNDLNYSAFAPFAPSFASNFTEQPQSYSAGGEGNSNDTSATVESSGDRGQKRRRLSEASDYSTSGGLQSPRHGPQDPTPPPSSRSNHSPTSSLSLSLHQSPTSPNFSISSLPFPSYEMYNQNQSSSAHLASSSSTSSSHYHPPMQGLWDHYHPPMNLLRDTFHPPMQLIPENELGPPLSSSSNNPTTSSSCTPQSPASSSYPRSPTTTYLTMHIHPPMVLPSYMYDVGEDEDPSMMAMVNDDDMSSLLLDPNGDGGIKTEWGSSTPAPSNATAAGCNERGTGGVAEKRRYSQPN